MFSGIAQIKRVFSFPYAVKVYRYCISHCYVSLPLKISILLSITFFELKSKQWKSVKTKLHHTFTTMRQLGLWSIAHKPIHLRTCLYVLMSTQYRQIRKDVMFLVDTDNQIMFEGMVLAGLLPWQRNATLPSVFFFPLPQVFLPSECMRSKKTGYKMV